MREQHAQVILAVVGAFGLVGWLVTVRAARAGRGWARWLVPGLAAVVLLWRRVG
ncbi:hypothetical protein [Nonomuraea sp. NPDC052265]|uniref:hypothetical protein n=1 Tax=Nonomuraea sp. NPDC052265 TaxID=3364374 RepID=UPI0037CA84A2